VGGGFFSGFAALAASEAWMFFGEGNGAASLEQMLARIGRYRRTPIAPGEDPVVGCVLIRAVRFFSPDQSIPPPPGFAPNIVQGKGYDLGSEHAPYFGDLMQRLLGIAVEIDPSRPWHRQGRCSAIPVCRCGGWDSRRSRRLAAASCHQSRLVRLCAGPAMGATRR
jgi:hypothetical protein